MKKRILASESFSASSKRHYFLDFKQEANNSHYIQFTRSEEQKDGSYKRWSFIVFQSHFEEFISAFSSLFQSAAYSGKGHQTVNELAEEARHSNRIKGMSPELRPREKLFEQGAKALSQSELLAILLGSGSPGDPRWSWPNASCFPRAGGCPNSRGGPLPTCAALTGWAWPKAVRSLPPLKSQGASMTAPDRKSGRFTWPYGRKMTNSRTSSRTDKVFVMIDQELFPSFLSTNF